MTTQKITEVTPLFTKAEVAEHFAVTPRSIENWVSLGLFPAPHRFSNRCVRWDAETLNRWIEAGCPVVDSES